MGSTIEQPQHALRGQLACACFQSTHFLNVYVPNASSCAGLLERERRRSISRDSLGVVVEVAQQHPTKTQKEKEARESRALGNGKHSNAHTAKESWPFRLHIKIGYFRGRPSQGHKTRSEAAHARDSSNRKKVGKANLGEGG